MDIPKALAAVVPVMAAAPAFASVDVSNLLIINKNNML